MPPGPAAHPRVPRLVSLCGTTPTEPLCLVGSQLFPLCSPLQNIAANQCTIDGLVWGLEVLHQHRQGLEAMSKMFPCQADPAPHTLQ